MPGIYGANQNRIYYEDINPRGEKTVLLLHGWPLNSKMYEYQLEILPEHGFRCIAVDFRGFGQSDTTAKGYDYNTMADDIAAVVRALRLWQFDLAGFSMGGAIAIRYISRYEGYGVRKLALLGAAAPSFTRRNDYPYGMSKVQVDALIEQAKRDRPQMVGDFGKMLFSSAPSPAFQFWMRLMGLSASGLGTVACAQSLRDEDLRMDLGKIHVPTGIFHGEKDQVCPFAFAREMQKGIADARLFAFANSGHAVFYEELEQFNHQFVRFLTEQATSKE